MKKLLLLLTIISHFVFGQNISTKYDATTKKSYLQTGVAPKANIVEYTDTVSGKSPIWQFDTPRIKYKNATISTDTSKFKYLQARSGDSTSWVLYKNFGGGGTSTIDTLKVGRIEQGRGTTAGSMYFNGVAWVKNDTSYVPQTGTNKFSGDFLSNQSFFTFGLNSTNNNIIYSDQNYGRMVSENSSSGIQSSVGAFSSSDGSIQLVVTNPTPAYSRQFVINGSNSATPNLAYMFDKGIAYYNGDYSAEMEASQNTIPSLKKVKQLISDSIAGGGGGTLTSVYSANSDILVDSSITGKRKLTLNKTLTSGYINIGDATNTAFPRALGLNSSLGTFGLSNLGVITFPASTTSTIGLLSTTDYTNILGTKTASYAYLAPLTGGQALFRYIRKQDLENQYDKLGNIINQTSWSSLTGYTNYGSATITVASNELVLNNASGTLDLTSGTAYTAYGNSNLDQVTLLEPIRVGTINSTNFGVGLNLKSNHGTAGSKRSIGVRVGFDTGNVGRLYFYQSDGTGVLVSTDARSSNLPSASISAGDALTLQLTFYRNTYVATLYKGQKAINTFTYIVPSTNPTNTDFVRQNCWQYAIQSYGGLNYITAGYTVRADDAKSSPILYIGDSITWGEGSTTTSNTFTSLINDLTGSECTVYASPGNRTDEVIVSEVLALQPRIIYMTIGTNNISKGDSPATFATKYANLVNALIAGGYRVGVNLFLSTIPPFSIDATAYNTEIVNYIATLSSPNVNTYYDAFALLRNGALTTLPPNYTGDGTHLTDIAQTVLAKGIYGYMANFLPYSSVKLSNQIPLVKDTYGNVAIGAGGTQKALVRLQVGGDATGNNSLVNLRDDPAVDDGVYLTPIGSGFHLSSGIKRLGGNWVARSAALSSYGNSNGIHIWYSATGQTIGSTVSLGSFERMRLDATGNLGIGTTTVVNKLDVEGGVAIGANYSGASTAPANGAIIEGNLGIGTTSTSAKVHIITTGDQLRSGYDASNYWRAVTGSTGQTAFYATGGAASFVFANTLQLNGGGTGANSQFNVRDNGGVNDGAYLTAIGSGYHLSGGVERLGGNWVARSAALSSYGNSNGIHIWYSATGQTIGSTVSLGSFETMRQDATGNLLIGGATTPTSLTKGLTLSTGVAPSASLIDGFIAYSADVSAGNATAFIRSEAGEIASLGSEFGMQSNHALNLTTNSTIRAIIAEDGSSLRLSSGLALIGAASQDIFNTTSTTVNAFGAATSGTIFGTSTASVTYGIGNNATASGNTKTIDIGRLGTSGSTTNITLGSAVSGSTSTVKANGTLELKSYTVATLPTCATGVYTYATVIDALAPTYNATVVGGGAIITPVFCNGTVWTSH